MKNLSILSNIMIEILEGVISPKPTEDKIVAPQYQPTTYLSRLLLVSREFPVIQVL